jgi:outer membrane protein insertion porin family
VQPSVFDNPSIRASVGFGFTWTSPVGPIRLDLAAPIKKESVDQTQFFRISFGTRF